MKSLLDRLNLRPQERRLVVGALIVVFLVLNLWLVWPRFGQAALAEDALQKSRITLNRYLLELNRTNDYNNRIRQLEGQGTAVLAEDQANTLIATIQSEARRCGLNTDRITPAARGIRPRTNEFFEESAITVGITPTDAESVIGFLNSLGTNSVAIRVKELDLTPDPSQTRLKGSMKLVASYQKNPPANAVRPTPSRPATNVSSGARRSNTNSTPVAK
jgi:type II secretory pathway component PulM